VLVAKRIDLALHATGLARELVEPLEAPFEDRELVHLGFCLLAGLLGSLELQRRLAQPVPQVDLAVAVHSATSAPTCLGVEDRRAPSKKIEHSFATIVTVRRFPGSTLKPRSSSGRHE
jgi:hypothetical protein